MKLCVKSPGSGGELIQGTLNGEPFLVTCPINLYAKATLLTKHAKLSQAKAYRAQINTLKYLGIEKFPYGIQLQSNLPHGKGLSSSSADIAAVCQLTALALGYKLTTQEISQIATSIEPTDGVFCEGIVQYNHLTGAIQRSWHDIPNIVLALFDLGGSVDTLKFNQRDDLKELNLAKEPLIQEALELLNRGLTHHDRKMIGKATTLSAFANQNILEKKELEKIYDIAMQNDALGINIAHSGTIIGMLFCCEQMDDLLLAIEKTKKTCQSVSFLKTVNLISGGLRIEEFTDDESI